MCVSVSREQFSRHYDYYVDANATHTSALNLAPDSRANERHKVFVRPPFPWSTHTHTHTITSLALGVSYARMAHTRVYTISLSLSLLLPSNIAILGFSFAEQPNFIQHRISHTSSVKADLFPYVGDISIVTHSNSPW